MNNQRPAKSSLSRSPAAKLASLLLVGVLALAVYKGWLPASVLTGGPSSPTSTQSTPASSAPTSPAKPAPAPESSAAMTAASSSPTVADLFRAQARDTWVETSARVTRLLDDDRETSDGSDQHQRFLAETTDNITILVSHNIDAASRVLSRNYPTTTFG